MSVKEEKPCLAQNIHRPRIQRIRLRERLVYGRVKARMVLRGTVYFSNSKSPFLIYTELKPKH